MIGVLFKASIESIRLLRRLDGDRVVHPVLGVDPVVRRDLTARAERDEQAVGDVALGQADLIGPGPVDVDLELGGVDDLVQVDVHRPWDLGDLFLDRAERPCSSRSRRMPLI